MTTTAAPFSLRRLSANDLPALLALHAAVMAALPDPGVFRLFGGAESFLSSHFGARGDSLGAFEQDRLLAYGSLTLPRAEDADNYAANLAWPPERAGCVALLSAAMVDPACRGRGLHPALVKARLDLALERGAPELLVRAAPANAQSRRTLLAHGFAVVWLGVQAGGALRHVMWRPTQLASRRDGGLVWAAADDLELQQRLLAEGRIGVRMRLDDDAIGFAKG